MAIMGYLVCRTCKEQTCLGKWLRGDDNVGVGFWRGGVEYHELGLKTLNFLARHFNHQVQFLSAGEYDQLSWTEPLHEYRNVEDLLRADWPADTNKDNQDTEKG